MTVLVIGIGNPDRADDAVGLEVVAALEKRHLPSVRLATLRGDMLALFDCWQDAATVILVDAMQSGAEPGCVRRMDATGGDIDSDLGTFVSTHAFNLADAIELARSLGRLPERLVVFGIEAQDFTPGAGLSPAVQRAVETVAAEVEEECQCTRRR